MDVGVIGTGNMGRNHARIYSEMRGVGEVFVYDADGAKGAAAAKQFGCVECKSASELFRKVDAVSICAPTTKHYEIAKQAISAGVNLLVEKPLSSEIAHAKELVKMVEKAKLVSGVGHIERFNPVVKEAKKLIKDVKYFEIKRHNPGSGRITDSDVVQDLMVHDIDIAWNCLFRDAKKELLGVAGIRNGTVDMALVTARFGKTLACISSSRLASKKVRSMIIEEEGRTIEADLITQEMLIYRKPDQYSSNQNAGYTQENIVEKVSISKVEPLRVELRAFLDCVKNGKEFEVSFADGLRVMEVAAEISGKVVA
ncbi:MAG: Gfo/Idh/MocA family oxidoreductase [Candidatus Micrarchaeota archaeon]|nr:Gfo/Idh/MocA family oxidoreductase [Candidatus Micrarchaeota archaeon]